MKMAPVSEAQAVADTVRWLELAVIGLQLCPFAKAVHTRGQIRYAVHLADEADGFVALLLSEAEALAAVEPDVRDTALVIAPNTLSDFLDFHAMTAHAERRLVKSGFRGVLQLASFHPRFCFAEADEADPSNSTNRSPYPMLHLLREESVGRAVAAFPDADAIYRRNIDVLRDLGTAGWIRLDVGPGSAAP